MQPGRALRVLGFHALAGARALNDGVSGAGAISLMSFRLRASLDLCTPKSKQEFELRFEHLLASFRENPIFPSATQFLDDLSTVAALPPGSYYRDLLDPQLRKIHARLESALPAPNDSHLHVAPTTLMTS